MKFASFISRKKTQGPSSRPETVFGEASRLAHQRLEECLADLHTRLAATKETKETEEQVDQPILKAGK